MEDSWSLYQGQSLQIKISKCSDVLQEWGKNVTGSFKRRISHIKKILKILKGRRDPESVRKYHEELKNLSEVYIQQEVFWKQRSKQLWIREGDSNNKYFHATAKTRRKVNHIIRLHNSEGQVVEWDSGLQDTMVEYFEDLFKSSDISWA